MKIRADLHRFSRVTLTGLIGLGLTLVLVVFMFVSTSLAASSLPPVDPPSEEGELMLTAPTDEIDLWQSGKEARSLFAESSPSPQDVALRSHAIRRSQDALAALGSTILLTETFSTATGSTPPAGWTNQIIAGEAGVDVWRFNNPGNRNLLLPIAAPAAIFDSDAVSGNSQEEDVALESPSFDASAHVYVGLDFDQYFRSNLASVNEIFVEVYDGTQWQSVYNAHMETPNPDHQFIDVTNHLAGVSNARIRFRYTGNYAYYWIVDNVRVFGLDQTPTDLALAKTAPVTVTVGAPFTYTLTITNQGNVEAAGVVVTDTLPPLANFISASAPCSEAIDHTVVCSLGAMSAAQSQNITIAVSAPDLGSRLVNQAMASTTTPEIDLTNNVTASTTTVIKAVQPGDRYVSTSGSDTTDCTNPSAPCLTVDFAGLNAHPGDVVHVAAGVYTASAQIDRALTIQGAGSAQTSLSGGDVRQVLNAAAPLHLKDLSVVNGRTPGKGGGLFTTQPLTLTNVRFAHNYSGDQGGAFFAVQSVVLSNTQLISNVSVDRGGAAYIQGPLSMRGSLVEQNRCLGEVSSMFIVRPCFGGGLFVYNHVDIVDSRFVNNHALVHGGGAVLGETNAHTVTLKNVEFTDNEAGKNAGGAFVHGNLVGDNLRFIQNKAGVCGGAMYSNSRVNLTNSRFIQNESGSLGGAIYFESKWETGQVWLTDVLYEENRSHDSGGGFFVAKSLSVDLVRTQFTGNIASVFGGGFGANPNIPVTITDSLIQGNQALTGPGGGAVIQGDSFVSNVSVISNTVPITGGEVARGGGLYIGGSTTTITNSRIASNAAFRGGGLYLTKETGNDSQVVLINVLLDSNNAAGHGAALYVNESGQTQILHTTIAASKLVTTSAVYVGQGTVGITNTIIAGHAVGIQQAQGSVFEDYTLFFANGNNRVGTVAGGSHSLTGDPAFVDPSTGNYHLGSGSAAIDAGMAMGIAHDLAQTPRPQGNSVDIGAYEATSTSRSLYLPLVTKE